MQNKSASWWSRGLTVYDKVFADKKHIKHTHTYKQTRVGTITGPR